MAQLLVRDLDESLVKRLKNRARQNGISAEEEHRRILKEVLSKPVNVKLTLIEFLLSDELNPDIELDLSRNREVASRDPGF